jgi:hypothetical protein
MGHTELGLLFRVISSVIARSVTESEARIRQLAKAHGVEHFPDDSASADSAMPTDLTARPPLVDTPSPPDLRAMLDSMGVYSGKFDVDYEADEGEIHYDRHVRPFYTLFLQAWKRIGEERTEVMEGVKEVNRWERVMRRRLKLVARLRFALRREERAAMSPPHPGSTRMVLRLHGRKTK